MYLRDFQLCLRDHDFDLYKSCREKWEPTELQVRKAIPSRYSFGDIKKIVIELGPEKSDKPHYRELLKVGLLHYPDFDARSFLASSPDQQQCEINSIIRSSMNELALRFNAQIDWLTRLLTNER